MDFLAIGVRVNTVSFRGIAIIVIFIEVYYDFS